MALRRKCAGAAMGECTSGRQARQGRGLDVGGVGLLPVGQERESDDVV